MEAPVGVRREAGESDVASLVLHNGDLHGAQEPRGEGKQTVRQAAVEAVLSLLVGLADCPGVQAEQGTVASNLVDERLQAPPDGGIHLKGYKVM